MPTTTVEEGIDVEYVDEGAGAPAIVLLHGFGLRAQCWREQIRTLAPAYRVVAPDLRGFGDSDASPDPATMSMDAYATDVLRLLDELGLERVVLVGHCLGAYAALDVVRMFPDRVGGLILSAAPFGPLPDESRSLEQQRLWLSGDGDLDYFVDWVRDALVVADGSVRGEVTMLLRNFMRQAPREGLIGALHAMEHRDRSFGDLEKIEIPTLLLRGEHDEVVDEERLEEIAGFIPDCRIEEVPFAGHYPQLEAPGPFTTRIVDFLAERY